MVRATAQVTARATEATAATGPASAATARLAAGSLVGRAVWVPAPRAGEWYRGGGRH